MNLLSLLGFVLAAVVLAAGVLTASHDPLVFLDPHAILIVFGGTLAATSIAFQLDRVFVLFKVFFIRVIRGRREQYIELVGEILKLSEAYRSNSTEVDKILKKTRYHFLSEAMSLGMDGILEHVELERVLRSRINSQYQRYAEEAVKFRTVGKYPPAFGLMGTTLGMISLLQKLGQPGAQKLLGPSMSVALIATFYGIALANLVFGPVAENLMDSAKETRLTHTIIVEGVLLIMLKTNPMVLAEELNSFLLPKERIDWRKAGRSGAARKEAA